MKRIIVLFIKGFIIGLGKVIPGVSGSVLAILLHVYEQGVYALSHFLEKPKSHLFFLLPTGCGILLSIVLGSRCILLILQKYYFPIMLLFCGLILGSIPMIKRKTNLRDPLCKRFFLISFLLCTPISFIKGPTHIYQTWNVSIAFYLILPGFVEATTMIIPGISGTAILMLMGVYPLVLNTFSHLLSLQYIYYNLSILLPFSVGLILGTILVTKTIYHFLHKNETCTYSAILGFSLSSVFLLLTQAMVISPFCHYVLGFILFFIGYYVSYFFASKE